MSPLKEALARTRPESRARSLVHVIHTESNRLSRGVEIAEIREAFRHNGGQVPESLTADIHSLKRRGVIASVGGRPGHTLFALPGASVGESDPDDDLVVVLRAVRRAWKRERRPLSTRQVRGELRRLGDPVGLRLLDGNSNRLRKRLEVLARHTERGPARARTPKVRKVGLTTPAGRTVSYWMPAGAKWDAHVDPAPPDRAAWIRIAVRQVESLSCIPASRRDLRWWHDHLPEGSSLKKAMPHQLIGRALADTARSDDGRRGDTLGPVTSSFTCFGGAPVRYVLGGADPVEQASVRVLDLAQMLRLEDELKSLDELRTRAGTLRSRELLGLVDLREQLLSWNLHEALDGHPLVDVQERLGGYLRELREWASAPILSPHRKEGRLRVIVDLERHLRALTRLSDLSSPERRPAFRAGQTALFNLWEMEPAVEAARKLLFLEEGTGKSLLDPVRRFPARGMDTGQRMGDPASVDLALLDRVDAVYTLFELFSVPRAWILLNQAHMLLGTAFRDFTVLNRMLEEDLEPFVREVVVLAVGWLGLPVSLQRGVGDVGNFGEVSAWVLSTVLADWFAAEDRLLEALPRVHGAAQQVVQRALMRLKVGAIFSVVG